MLDHARVFDDHFGQLVIDIRTLSRSGSLFDVDARAILARELLAAAARLSPHAARLLRRRLVRSTKRDRDGSPLYRVSSWG